MEIKPGPEVLEEIIKKTRKNPTGWRCVVSKDESRFSNEYYILHPAHGIYEVKEYQKNPYMTRGVGMRLARRVDEGLYNDIEKGVGEFTIMSENPYKVLESVKRGIPLSDILEAGLMGKDLGIRVHARGPATGAKSPVGGMFSKERRALNRELDEILKNEGVRDSYG